MPKQWDKQTAISAYMYLQNGMYLKVVHIQDNTWHAGLWIKMADRGFEITDWEFQAASIESAKDLAYAKLKLWLAELVERVG